MRKEKPVTESSAAENGGEAAEAVQASAGGKEDDVVLDIEAEIAAEVKDMRKPTTDPLFTNVKMEVQCGKFSSSSSPSLSYTRHIPACTCGFLRYDASASISNVND